MKPEDKLKGIYRHTKSGRDYEVLGLAVHTESHQRLVLYRPLYEGADYEFFVRPLSMFTENAEINGQLHRRFEKVERGGGYIV